MRATSHRSVFLPLMAGLLGLTWLLLWLWEQSSYGRYLNHGTWDERALIVSLCRALPAGEIVVPLILYVLGWTLMTTAMMLPTTLPLLEIFRRLTRARADAGRLLALAIAGYLAVWAGFGVAAHIADLLVFELVLFSPWLQVNGWALGAGTLLLAAAFQFSPLKYRCLDKCRTPMSFVIERWRGRQQSRHAFLLGAGHGLFCVGCCWALMLLMFVVGTGNVGWMLALGAVMAAEKNLPWGRRLSAPLGIALFAWAGFIAAQNLAAWA